MVHVKSTTSLITGQYEVIVIERAELFWGSLLSPRTLAESINGILKKRLSSNTVGGGIGSGGRRFRPRCFGVVTHRWSYGLRSESYKLYSLRVSSALLTNLSRSAIDQ